MMSFRSILVWTNTEKQNTLCFIYGSNYLAGAYGYYAASALAGNAVMRSIFGGTLPLAGPIMYRTLTPQWAGTLLGLLEVCLIPIPLAFYRYGERIRAGSAVIRDMREEQARNDKKRARLVRRQERQRAATAAAGGGRDEEDRDGHYNGGGKDEEGGLARGLCVDVGGDSATGTLEKTVANTKGTSV